MIKYQYLTYGSDFILYTVVLIEKLKCKFSVVILKILIVTIFFSEF